MLTYLQAIILGIVEGITEFLPISSTGHLILTANFLNIQNSDFLKSFEIIIQLGAILAVLLLYWKLLQKNKVIIYKILIAFIPTGIIGLAFYKLVKQYLLGNSIVTIYSLLIGGVVIILFEKKVKFNNVPKNIEQITYRDALIIGTVQSLAIIPGVSRAAATIIGGLALGFERKSIVEFSFLLAIPTMLAAAGFDLMKNYSLFSENQLTTLSLGFVVSFLSAIVAVKWLVKFVKNHNFVGFGIYRIIAAVVAFIVI